MSLDWFPWYATDFRRDTYHLSAGADGIYRRLIDEYMVSGKPLPDNDSSLAAIARVSPDEWGSNREVVRAFFKAKAGRLYLSERQLAYLRPPSALRPRGEQWKALRRFIFERDDFTCRYCGQRGGRLECDHVVAVSRGGSHELDNLATACFSCNRSKRDKTLAEWGSHGRH